VKVVQLILALRCQENPVGNEPRDVFDLAPLGERPESGGRLPHHVQGQERLATEPADVELTEAAGGELPVELVEEPVQRLCGELLWRVAWPQ
jgi:hypothetical protein